MAIPDDVWRRLDPDTGRLSRRATLRVWLAVLIVPALVAAAILVWRTGLVVPHLTWDGYSHTWRLDEERPGIAEVDIDIRNEGRFAATVLAVGRSSPQLQLLETDGTLPVRLRPGDGLGVVLTYRVTQCSPRSDASWQVSDETPRPNPLVVQVERPWGTMMIDVEPQIRRDWEQDIISSYCDQRQPR